MTLLFLNISEMLLYIKKPNIEAGDVKSMIKY